MAKITFWEKPGCVGNARQKQILTDSGHQLEVKNLLTEAWSDASLRPFFGSKAVSEWFNMTNPEVKAGTIVPSQLSEEEALALMVKEPLLVRRPLMQAGDKKVCGFDVAQIDQWLGLNETSVGAGDPQACPHPETNCD